MCCCTSLPASFSRRLCVLLSYLLLSDLQESEGLGHWGGRLWVVTAECVTWAGSDGLVPRGGI